MNKIILIDLPPESRQVRLLLNSLNEQFIWTIILQYILIGLYIQDRVLDIISKLQ